MVSTTALMNLKHQHNSKMCSADRLNEVIMESFMATQMYFPGLMKCKMLHPALL